jgi:hypothetical protein
MIEGAQHPWQQLSRRFASRFYFERDDSCASTSWPDPRCFAMPPPMQITIDREADTFTLTGKVWANTYPLEDMQKWLEFYRRQSANFPKADGAYDDIIGVLEQGMASLQTAE